MKKTLKIPDVLFRMGESAIKENGEMELSISSSTPYKRYDWRADEEYYEVLKHSPESVDTERLKAGAALLFNHDRNIQLGTISAPEFRDGKCFVKAKLSAAEDVKSYRTRIDEGILKDTSVGYQIVDEGECTGAKDGIPIYEFRWLPHEASLVTIPADITVGVGRARAHEIAEHKEIKFREINVEVKNAIDDKQKTTNNTDNDMKHFPARKFSEADKDKGGSGDEKKEAVVIDVVAERAAGRAAYRAACDKIDKWAGAHTNPQWKAAALEVALKHKAMDEPDYGAFLDEARTKFEGVIALTQEQANPNVGIDRDSIRRFSVVKAIREMSDPRGGLTGLEKKVCEFAAEQYEKKDGRVFMGACIPSDITDARADETFDLNKRGLENMAWEIRRLNEKLGRTMNASTFASGGFLVGTDLMAGSYIDYLRNACFIGQGPFSIIELSGLVGNIAIPKQTSTASTYWLPEGGTVTASEFAGSQLYFTPHRLACLSQFTKQLLLQSTPSVEMLVRNDQARAVGVEEDRVVYNGSGASGEPIGILNTTGVDASVTFSGNWTQAKSLAFELAIENANANTIGEMVFATSPTTKSYAKGTPQVAASTFPIYIWMPSMGQYPTIAGSIGGIVNGYGAYATKQLGNTVLFGIYNNNVVKARWGGFDLMVEPYTGAATETIKSYLNEWMDVGVRYPQAFSKSTDAPTNV